MSAKRKAKERVQPKDEFDGWSSMDGGGVLQGGTKFAKPPCPVGSHGFHQYEKREDLSTKDCRVWECRLCDRRLGVNRKNGNVRERKCA